MKYSIALLTATLLASGSAHATPIHSSEIENTYQDINIPMTRSQLDAEVSMEQAQRERSERPVGSLEAGVSSWQPSDLRVFSRLSDPSDFSLAGPPQINLNAVTPLGREFNLKLGAGFLALERTATLTAAGQSADQSQTIYITSARLGGEYAPRALATTYLRPYLTATVIPSLLVTGRTALNDGESLFGVPFEVGGGTLIHVLESLDLNLSVQEVLGKIKDSNMNGFGLSAGVRVPL
jgi:hypothetical protein